MLSHFRSGNFSIPIPFLIFVYFFIGKADSSVEDGGGVVSSGIALKEKWMPWFNRTFSKNRRTGRKFLTSLSSLLTRVLRKNIRMQQRKGGNLERAWLGLKIKLQTSWTMTENMQKSTQTTSNPSLIPHLSYHIGYKKHQMKNPQGKQRSLSLSPQQKSPILYRHLLTSPINLPTNHHLLHPLSNHQLI